MAALAAGALLVPVLASVPTAEAVPTTTTLVAPRAVPAAPMPGELFLVVGRLGGPGTRKVVLQRRSPAGEWVAIRTGRTARNGRYEFSMRTLVAKVALRVEAPRTRDKQRVRTPSVVVSTVPQQSLLSGSGDRTTATLTTTLTPVRPGRTVRLQTYAAGWRTLQVATQSTGSLQWTLGNLPGLPRQYRIKAAGYRGVDPYFSEPTTFTPAPVASGLPRIHLSTANAAPVADRVTYLPGTLSIDDGPALPMQIRGRGNGTWKWPKKPYRIKLDAKSPLLGMPTEKDWVLLANFTDRSLLRTSAAFGIAEATSLAWTPKARFVDVSLNGVDIGNYQLVESVEATATKVPLVPGGLLLEVDHYYPINTDPGFTTAHGTPIAYKDPDDPTVEEQAQVQASVAAFEAALYGDEFTDPVNGYTPYVDLDSFADWYLVNEVMKNVDGDFFSSAFVSWDPAGKFTMGPVWDFDLSIGYVSAASPGCCASSSDWWLRGGDSTGRPPLHSTHWLTRMTADPTFLALVQQRWHDVVRPAVTARLAALPAEAAALVASAALDWTTWRDGFTPAPGTEHAISQPGETDYLVTWLTDRVAWIDSQLGT